MEEKRTYSRESLNLDATAVIGELKIVCNIINLSDGGAFLKAISDEVDIKDDLIGKKAVFYISQNGVRYDGEIVRIFYRESDSFFAVRFFGK